MTGGSLLGVAAVLGWSQVQQLWQLYAVYAVFAVGFSAAGLIPVTTVVTRWYHVRRSVALSVASTGATLRAIPDEDLAELPDLGGGFNVATMWRHLLTRLP